MERIPEYGLSSWQAGGMGNGVHIPEMAQALALVDAGIGAGVFGYDMAEPRDAAQFETLDEARLEAAYAEDALAHEHATLAQGRKSKLALLRGEADGSVRGLRNAVISIGHWFDLDHVAGEGAPAATDSGYAESWRIGWAERLPEIMQLSVDGPLESMGLEDTGHVPPRAPVSDLIGTLGGAGATERELPGPSAEARTWLQDMLTEEREPDDFVFAVSHEESPGSQPMADQAAAAAAEDVFLAESQYVALHGPLFDGDALWKELLEAHLDELASDDHHGQDAHLRVFDEHFG